MESAAMVRRACSNATSVLHTLMLCIITPYRARAVRQIADIHRGVRVFAVIALMFTSLLAVAGYMVQSKNATDADKAQHEIVQEAADREQARGLAAIQLERVRSQMGEVYRPVSTMIAQADKCAIYMQRELGFEFNEIWGVGLVRPFGGNPVGAGAEPDG